MEQKGVNTKRKRAYNQSIPKESDVLQLENVGIVKNEVSIVSDDKVRNSIKKFGSNDDKVEDTFIKFIVCPSEAEYFENNLVQLTNDMKNDFGLQDVSISSNISGGIDRFITLYGSKTAIAKSSTYCSFILAKINNFTKNQLTLKSSTYRLTVLLSSCHDYQVKGLRRLEIIKHYQYNRELSAAYLYGDFNNIYNFIIHSTDSGGSKYTNDDTRIHQQELFGIHLTANISDRSNEKNQLLSNSKNRALEFVSKYSTRA